jgi:GDPmannose 4,6-dehydratase
MRQNQRKQALITGITGQDGSYIAELLLSKGYEVHGLVRRTSVSNRERIEHLIKNNKITLHIGDVTDGGCLDHLVADILPAEVYHFAAQSHVGVSFINPEYTLDATGLSALRILEAIRKTKKTIKFYQASSSEMFGNSNLPQNELTPFNPASPYGIAKVMAFYAVKNYRESYGLFAVNGILFNHESPRRGEEFVTRKITLGLARIKAGLQKELVLGNLDAKRDWGYAPEYMEAVWKIMQYDKPEDFVIATGETHSIREFLDLASSYAGIDWKQCVKTNKEELRPKDINCLIGDASKAKKLLSWQPKVKFSELVKIMMEADLAKFV